MKTKKTLKLTQINKTELSKNALNQLIGGAGDCYCACEGSASTAMNDSFNNADDLVSYGYCKCWVYNEDGTWVPGYGIGDGVAV